ncbi:hypothetical protein D3C81_1508240 [compost metagenome]
MPFEGCFDPRATRLPDQPANDFFAAAFDRLGKFFQRAATILRGSFVPFMLSVLGGFIGIIQVSYACLRNLQ